MIPQSISLVPLAVIIVLAVGALVFAAFKAATGAARSEPGSKVRRNGTIVAGIALLISVFGLSMLANILIGHDSTYETLVWMSLNENYGIAPAADGQGFTPGAPFAAVINGENVTCTVMPPEDVRCEGEPVELLTAGK